MWNPIIMGDRAVRALAWLVVGGLGVFACIGGISAYLSAGDMAWTNMAEQSLKNLATVLRLYHEDHGRYPESIESALVLEGSQADDVRLGMQTFRSQGVELSYRPSSNGFGLKVVRRRSFLRPTLTVEKSFMEE